MLFSKAVVKAAFLILLWLAAIAVEIEVGVELGKIPTKFSYCGTLN